MVCERCGKQTNTHTMSMFNMENICMECKDKERKHPKYREAQEAERQAVRNGNYNFPGIGKPADL